MMKSWPVKIREKGTRDQERGRSQHLGPVKMVNPNRPHGNSIYCPTDVSGWTVLKVRTRTVTTSFPGGDAGLSIYPTNVLFLCSLCTDPPPLRKKSGEGKGGGGGFVHGLFFCSLFEGLNPFFFARFA